MEHGQGVGGRDLGHPGDAPPAVLLQRSHQVPEVHRPQLLEALGIVLQGEVGLRCLSLHSSKSCACQPSSLLLQESENLP